MAQGPPSRFTLKRRLPIRNAALILALISLVTTTADSFLLPRPTISNSKLCVPFTACTGQPATLLWMAKQNMAKPKGKKGGGKASTTKNKKNNNSKKSATKKPAAAAPGMATTAASRQPRAPPWQVLSTKDAKKNVEREKVRRERIKLGLEEEEEVAPQEVTVAKNFLNPVDRSFLSWKRFNPSTASSGMKFVAAVLGKQLPPRLGVPEVAFLGR